MNKLAMTTLAAAFAFAHPAFANDAHHPGKAQAEKSAPARPAAAVSAQKIQKMRDNVKKMPSQLDRIARAKTDEERQKALAEHMQTMHENMEMMHEMMGGMMDCPMMGEGMMDKGDMGMMGGRQAGAMMERMQQMEKRMDMMQMMMEQMMHGSGAMSEPMPMK